MTRQLDGSRVVECSCLLKDTHHRLATEIFPVRHGREEREGGGGVGRNAVHQFMSFYASGNWQWEVVGTWAQPGTTARPRPKIGPGVRLCQRTYSPLEAP